MKIIETPNWENSKVRQMEKDFNFEILYFNFLP